MCEEAEFKIVGKSVFVKLRSGAVAFIPLEQICNAIVAYNICPPKSERIKC